VDPSGDEQQGDLLDQDMGVYAVSTTSHFAPQLCVAGTPQLWQTSSASPKHSSPSCHHDGVFTSSDRKA
jgi:hypothetical protein